MGQVVFFVPLGDSYFDAIEDASPSLTFSIFIDMVRLSPGLRGCRWEIVFERENSEKIEGGDR